MSNETRITPRPRKSFGGARKGGASSLGRPSRTPPPMKRNPVMLAVSGSEISTSVLDVAALAAERLGSDLRLVSVVEPVIAYGLPHELQGEALTLDRNAREVRDEQVKKLATRAKVATARTSTEVRMGGITAEICDAVSAANATLVVVGANPQRRMRRIVTGRRAAHVLHRTDSPVLSVVPWLHSLPRKVVAAIDFSPASLFAAEIAAQLLASGGTLTLVHVVPLNLLFPATNPLAAKMRRNAENELAVIAEKLGERAPSGSTVQYRVLEGDPVAELLDLTATDGADLLALGTRSGSTLRRVFVGSVATELFQSALVSVLASPPPSAADQVALSLELSGTAVITSRNDFATVLKTFSDANAGKTATLEENDPDIGAQTQVHGYQLRGVVFDKASGDVEVMLGSATDRAVHLTRTIPKASSLTVVRLAGDSTALRIEHGSLATLVLVGATK